MNFEFRLELPTNLAPEESEEIAYDPDLDDERSVLRDVCASLGNVPGVRFHICVGKPIAVSVRRDLVTVMEQLPDVLSRLRDGKLSTLDLYEQGVETRLILSPTDERIRVDRRPLVGHDAPSCELCLPATLVMPSFFDLARVFIDAASCRSPQIAAHPWFVSWSQSLLALCNPIV